MADGTRGFSKDIILDIHVAFGDQRQGAVVNGVKIKSQQTPEAVENCLGLRQAMLSCTIKMGTLVSSGHYALHTTHYSLHTTHYALQHKKDPSH